MKKTISITLGGRVFLIEEDGFHVLEAYLNGLKEHYSQDDSVVELMADIETGLAEKCSDRLGSQKQALTREDVEEVIRVMGRLEDLTAEEGAEASSVASERVAETNDREKDSATRKRLYRDSDDQMIAGVCSGLAAYFGVSIVLIRIAFIILTFVNGLGILLYLILWVVMPLAETQAQKFEMRGKPLNVDEIEQMVKEKAQTMGREGKKMLSLPAAIIGAILAAIQSVVRVVWPIVTTIIGVCLLLGTILGIIFTTIGATMLLFPSRSPFFLSDLPLKELALQPFYHVGVMGFYLLFTVPLVCLILLAVTLLRRRNVFRLLPMAVLLGVWILAASASALALRDIAPWAYQRAQEVEQQATVTRSFSETGFTSIVAADSVQIKVIQGESYSIQATGLERDVATLSLVQKDGILTISRRAMNQGPCLFCLSRPLEISLTMPTLLNYTASDATRSTINGFKADLGLSVRDAARLTIQLEGQNVTSTIRDAGRLVMTGTIHDLVISLSDVARLDADMDVFNIVQITQRDASRAELRGKASKLTADLKDISRLEADALDVLEKDVKTEDAATTDLLSNLNLE
ncbi:PspC domain-containing protein [Patescibacteria group bacterium]|nr:PspC domain-containing protein [Patescibacteria group bacterium]